MTTKPATRLRTWQKAALVLGLAAAVCALFLRNTPWAGLQLTIPGDAFSVITFIALVTALVYFVLQLAADLVVSVIGFCAIAGGRLLGKSVAKLQRALHGAHS